MASTCGWTTWASTIRARAAWRGSASACPTLTANGAPSVTPAGGLECSCACASEHLPEQARHCGGCLMRPSLRRGYGHPCELSTGMGSSARRRKLTVMQFEHLGYAPDFVDYQQAWEHQREVHAAVVARERPDVVLLLEHQAVFTAGKRTEPHERPFDGTPVIDMDRGGKVTCTDPAEPWATRSCTCRATRTWWPTCAGSRT